MSNIETYTPGMSEGFTGKKTTFLRDVWDDLYDALQMKTILQGKVSGVEKDGEKRESIVVFIDNVKGIILEEEIGESRPKHLGALIGSRINFKVKRCDRTSNIVYLSRKDALDEMSGATWQELRRDAEPLLEIQKQIEDLRKGEEFTQETKRAIGELNSRARAVGFVRTATVRAVFKEGAYVDIGGVSVFLPAHEMSWGKVEDAREIVKPGESFDIKIIRVDFDSANVRASLKATMPDPWDTVEQRYAKGSVYSGTVARTTARGDLVVEIEPGVGVTCKRLPLQRLNKGANVRVKIAFISPAKRFINGFLVGESRWVS